MMLEYMMTVDRTLVASVTNSEKVYAVFTDVETGHVVSCTCRGFRYSSWCKHAAAVTASCSVEAAKAKAQQALSPSHPAQQGALQAA
jgi:uncharacterized Zn finger protein